MADLNRNGIDDYFEDPYYGEELNQYMMGTGGFGAPSGKVYVPSFGQPAFRTTEALLAMPNAMEVTPSGMDYNSSLFPDTDYFSSTYTPSFEGLYNSQTTGFDTPPPLPPHLQMDGNVDLMGNPLREQPSVEEIRRRTQADKFGGDSTLYANQQETNAGLKGFFSGLGRVFTDFSGQKMRDERYGVPQPAEIAPAPMF